MTPRMQRCLNALLNGPRKREQLDQEVGASNSPAVVGQLRRALGITVPCDRVAVIDRDGRSVRPGVYSLSADDIARVRSWWRTQGI